LSFSSIFDSVSADSGTQPDGSIFNGGQNVLPNSYFQTLTPGMALDNNDLNPLVYSAPRM